jgi:hypothetical protein
MRDMNGSAAEKLSMFKKLREREPLTAWIRGSRSDSRTCCGRMPRGRNMIDGRVSWWDPRRLAVWTARSFETPSLSGSVEVLSRGAPGGSEDQSRLCGVVPPGLTPPLRLCRRKRAFRDQQPGRVLHGHMRSAQAMPQFCQSVARTPQFRPNR